MSSLLSDYWVIEYSFLADACGVVPLRDYLSATQGEFHRGEPYQSVVLAVHPTHEGASEECEVWQARCNARGLTPRQRLERLQPYISGLESFPPDLGRSDS